ncbi:MAG: c-type cytochrome [Phenylobacterium sp.]|nr:c-type cytochrome [Phenylobacterium sp.]
MRCRAPRASRYLALTVALLLASCQAPSVKPTALPGADPGEGRRVIEAIGCGACHDIPGVAWPKGRTGPPLAGFAHRPLIAGALPNQPETLVIFLRDAPSLAPQTGMPPMPLTEQEARDVAAYLYTLDAR